MASTTAVQTFQDTPPVNALNIGGANAPTLSEDSNYIVGAKILDSAKYIKYTHKLVHDDGPNKNIWITDFHCAAIGNGKVYITCIYSGTASYAWDRETVRSGSSDVRGGGVEGYRGGGHDGCDPSRRGTNWGGFNMRVAVSKIAENIIHYGPGIITPPGFVISLQENKEPVTVRISRAEDTLEPDSPIGWCFTFVLPGKTRYTIDLISTPLLSNGHDDPNQAVKKVVSLDLTSL